LAKLENWTRGCEVECDFTIGNNGEGRAGGDENYCEWGSDEMKSNWRVEVEKAIGG